MTIELLQTLSIVSFVVVALLLIIGIALFFIFDIPKLYWDVSGKTAKEAIAEIRKKNAIDASNPYNPSSVNAARGQLTEKLGEDEYLHQSMSDVTSVLEETTNLDFTSGATEILTGHEETDQWGKAAKFTVDVEMSFTESSRVIE
jgi:hypothetical protein